MNFVVENLKNPKTILIVSGLIAVIVFSVMLIGYESYLNTLIVGSEICSDGIDNDGDGLVDEGCGTTATCTDSDGGINVMKKGTAKDNSHSYTDYCVGNSIVEYFCDNGIAKRASDSSSGYSCSTYGQNMICKNGACVKGTSCGVGLTLCGGKCVNLNSDFYNCGYCGNKCSSGYKCQSGICIKEITSSCTDSDGGINVMKKGTTKDNFGSYIDYCVENSIVEYFCQNGVAKRASDSPSGYSCSTYGQNMICQNGACVEGPTCGVGLTLCRGKCVNLNSDVNNCGGCGYKCSSGYKCQSGDCVKEELDPTCEADGKCKLTGCPTGDPDCPCSQHGGVLGGFICQANETCPGTSLKHSGTGICCSVACAQATVYSISGKITSSENISVSGIAINLTGTSSASTATNSSGSYSFSNLTNGSYTITPSKSDYIFNPVSKNITISGGNSGNINFNAILKECNLEETKKHSCPDGTKVNWCTCDNYKWACIDSPENNCPATCEADGKCKTSGCPTGDPDCSCSEYEPSGFICQADETCSGTSLKHSGTGICCSVACESGAVYQTADLNCDGNVNLTDSAILMSFWGKDPSGAASCQSPDINQDGKVNLTDSAIMMSQWTIF